MTARPWLNEDHKFLGGRLRINSVRMWRWRIMRSSRVTSLGLTQDQAVFATERFALHGENFPEDSVKRLGARRERVPDNNKTQDPDQRQSQSHRKLPKDFSPASPAIVSTLSFRIVKATSSQGPLLRRRHRR